MNARKFRNWLKRSGHQFAHVDSDRLQYILNEKKGHGAAFLWHETPQGSDFWFCKKAPLDLSKRTRQFLAKLRDEAKRRGC